MLNIVDIGILQNTILNKHCGVF